MKRVLITGGSSGIGLEMSKLFAQNNFEILWVSLLKEEIEQAIIELKSDIPQAIIHYRILDLSEETAAHDVMNWVNSNQWYVDVLINNAGFATYGLSSHNDFETEVKMIQLNIVNLYRMTKLFLDKMLEKNVGTIINISSTTSLKPVPKMAAYAATKAFVAHYSQALQHELSELDSDVRVMTICPAAIKDTKFKEAAKMNKVKTFEGLGATTKKEVAKDVWNAYIGNQNYVISGAKMRKLTLLSKLLPDSIIYKLMRDQLSES